MFSIPLHSPRSSGKVILLKFLYDFNLWAMSGTVKMKRGGAAAEQAAAAAAAPAVLLMHAMSSSFDSTPKFVL